MEYSKIHQPPNPYKILICVTGMSPQIVTETLFALSVAQEKPWIPDEVRLITTLRGADHARLMLLSEHPGWFQKLLQDWKLPSIRFDASHIHVLRTPDGQMLDDIRDDQDNQHAANGISEVIQQLTQDEHTEIHASIAGGRKTMGFFMGYAMSLWGRPQDKLSHVLVSASYESRPEFYYPAPTVQVITARGPDQDPLDASKAQVWLGDIPFVRLRSLMPPSLLTQHTSFASAVAAANRALDQIDLVIDTPRKRVLINGCVVKLPPMQMAVLSLLAWHSARNLPALRAPHKEVDDPEWKQEALATLRSAIGSMHIPDTLMQRLLDKQPFGETFTQTLSKLEKKLHDSGALPLKKLIQRSEDATRARQRQYRLAVHPENIHFR